MSNGSLAHVPAHRSCSIRIAGAIDRGSCARTRTRCSPADAFIAPRASESSRTAHEMAILQSEQPLPFRSSSERCGNERESSAMITSFNEASTCDVALSVMSLELILGCVSAAPRRSP